MEIGIKDIKEEAIKSQIKLETQLLYNPLVTSYLKSNFGENSIKVISAAMEEMTDDAIAARCKLKVAEVRAILNKLYNYKMAEYKRIKDRDTGWFSYLWKIDVSNILEIIKEQTANRISELDRHIEKMNTEFIYYCPQCSKTNLISFDLAADLMFRCPNCESKLLEKEKESKEFYEQELVELKSKHLSLLEDIRKFEELKRQEEIRLKELQAKIAEMTRIEEISKAERNKRRTEKKNKTASNKKTHKKVQSKRNNAKRAKQTERPRQKYMAISKKEKSKVSAASKKFKLPKTVRRKR
ncbi:MAG: hypothetical protein N3G74_02250 [Candidatus Micrarchaeota archaeon]|nr:hypothetical protein [Candidatus Micrarchaeota archaeon]